MSEDPSKRLRRTSSQKKKTDSTNRRRQSKQKTTIEQQKPRYSVNAMDDEDIAPYYERLVGGMFLAAALLIGYGVVTIIGRLRSDPVVFPDVLANVPIEVVLIFAGLLIFLYQEPATFIIAASSLFWTIVPRWLTDVDNSFPLQNWILFIAVVYFATQFINFRRARERYKKLPEKHKNPDIEIKDIRSDKIYPWAGLGISIVGLALVLGVSVEVVDAIYGSVGSWLGVLGFSISLASAIAYYDRRVIATIAAVLGAAAISFWISVQVVAASGFLG